MIKYALWAIVAGVMVGCASTSVRAIEHGYWIKHQPGSFSGGPCGIFMDVVYLYLVVPGYVYSMDGQQGSVINFSDVILSNEANSCQSDGGLIPLSGGTVRLWRENGRRCMQIDLVGPSMPLINGVYDIELPAELMKRGQAPIDIAPTPPQTPPSPLPPPSNPSSGKPGQE